MAKYWWAVPAAIATLTCGVALAQTGETTGTPEAPATPEERVEQSGTEVTAVKLGDLDKDQVMLIQQKLKDEGLYKASLDGIAGPKTKQALNDFASQKGMAFDENAIEPNLLAEFNIAPSDIQPVKGTTKGKAKPAKTPGATTGTSGAMTKPTETPAEKKTQSGTEEPSSSPASSPSSSSEVQPQSGMDSSTAPASGGDTSVSPTHVNAGTSPSQAGSSMGGAEASPTPNTGIEPQRGTEAVEKNPNIVLQAQLALKEKGILKGPATGALDKETTNAVKEFQKENKLNVTGKLDSKTLTMLGVNTAPDAVGTPVTEPQKGIESTPAPSSSPVDQSGGGAYPH